MPVEESWITGTKPELTYGAAVNAAHVFWTENAANKPALGRANIDGSGATPGWLAGIAPEGSQLNNIAVSATHIYWGYDDGGGTTWIGRCLLDGSELEPEWLNLGAHGAPLFAIDGTYIYWTTAAGPWVGRILLSGAAPEPEWLEVPGSKGLNLTVTATRIYWASGFLGGSSAFLGRALIDGSTPEPEWVNLGEVGAAESGIKAGPEYLYFSHPGPNIGRVKLNTGTVTASWVELEEKWEALAIALDGEQAYWTAEHFPGEEGRVGRASHEPEEEEPEPEPDPPPAAGSYIESIRERPPLRLNLDVQSPDGRHTRWGWDDPDPGNAPMDLFLSSVMPGGYERLSCVLERDSRLSYPDLAELSTITARGAGGDVAWQGRLEKTPDTGGFQQQVQPEAVGWQAHMEDDNTARERYVDIEQAGWGDAPNDRKIALLNGTYGALISPESTSSGAPDSGGISSLITQLTGAWATRRASEGWYDSAGIPIGLLKYVWMLQAAGKIGDDETSDPNFEWRAKLTSSSTDAGPGVDSGNLRGAGPEGSGTLVGNALSEVWAYLQLLYTAAGGAGTDGVVYPVFWPVRAVYGRHGLPLYGALSKDGAPGVLSSDAVANALSRWARKIGFTTGPGGTIKPSTFVVPQLSFPEPTNAAEMVKQATRFELPDWAVWEGPTFYMNPRGERGKHWRARVGPAQLQQAGPQAARLWNGVIVSYSDSAGVQRTVGPPGSAAEAVSSRLIDEDPENPLNQLGIPKYAPLKMGTSSLAGATQVGAIFLREQAQLETSGQATLVGHVEDESGVLYPAWAVKGGDTIAFVDASDPSPRRIVHAGYEDPTRSCQVQLDQPPDSLTAILERLSAAIQPLGFT